jgi:hypothetical protein
MSAVCILNGELRLKTMNYPLYVQMGIFTSGEFILLQQSFIKAMGGIVPITGRVAPGELRLILEIILGFGKITSIGDG